ncbi:MAG: hypothetical protein ABI769_13410 [Pseudomonadota bacterium]
MAASVRLAWPHLPGNPPDYVTRMESAIHTFLAFINRHVGPILPDP